MIIPEKFVDKVEGNVGAHSPQFVGVINSLKGLV